MGRAKRQSFKNSTIESYKLALEYMEVNKVSLCTACKDLKLCFSSLTELRASLINGDFGKNQNMPHDDVQNLRAKTYEALSAVPQTSKTGPKLKLAKLVDEDSKPKMKKYRDKKPAAHKKPDPLVGKVDKPSQQPKVVCFVGNPKDVAAALAGLLN